MMLLVALTALAAAPALAAPASRPLDPDIRACVRPGEMTAREIEACLDRLVRASADEMAAAYESALSRLEPGARALLRKAQEAFHAYARGEAEAGRAVWGRDAGLGKIDAMINGVTRARERRDELLRLYVAHPAPAQ